jgi:hypothetical protein
MTRAMTISDAAFGALFLFAVGLLTVELFLGLDTHRSDAQASPAPAWQQTQENTDAIEELKRQQIVQDQKAAESRTTVDSVRENVASIHTDVEVLKVKIDVLNRAFDDEANKRWALILAVLVLVMERAYARIWEPMTGKALKGQRDADGD